MENKINIGELDTLITVYSVEITTGQRGEKIYTPTEHSRVFAKLEQSMDEAVSNTNLEAAVYATATIYKIPGITTRWQIGVGDVRYTITGIDPVSRISPLCRLSIRILE